MPQPRGQPAHRPTDETRKTAETLSGLGLPQSQIAILIGKGIDVKTLTKHYATELEAGKAKANSQVTKNLFQKCMSGDTTAQIWWTKTQLGWKDTSRVEHTGADGKDLTVTMSKNDASL